MMISWAISEPIPILTMVGEGSGPIVASRLTRGLTPDGVNVVKRDRLPEGAPMVIEEEFSDELSSASEPSDAVHRSDESVREFSMEAKKASG
ncbi:hypothetical protein DD592_27640 [Enterobacter cloacae complex sp. 2DZ2F20B]|nr:hypothetical protein DD592_27640 [Enterobacter cloacae complex sp. 2DZ2F20B]